MANGVRAAPDLILAPLVRVNSTSSVSDRKRGLGNIRARSSARARASTASSRRRISEAGRGTITGFAGSEHFDTAHISGVYSVRRGFAGTDAAISLAGTVRRPAALGRASEVAVIGDMLIAGASA